MSAIKKSGLGSKGRGITALINSEVDTFSTSSEFVLEIDINKIEPNKNQPRKRFEENALLALAESIKDHGVIQPIIVNKTEDYFELVAGERRWRASKIAGLNKIPAIVKNYDEESIYEIALIENLQREDLNSIEEANGYKKLNEEFGLSQEEISKRVSKSRSAVANIMRLLNLDPRVQIFVIEGKLSGGHARALLSVEDGNLQFELAERIIEDNLNVRQVESLVKYYLERKSNNNDNKVSSKESTQEFHKIEETLKTILGTKVNIKGRKNK
ncbi:MAG: ParB/RepB/Spo0J family partition protein, partial [Anaerotignaceae bacterium]